MNLALKIKNNEKLKKIIMQERIIHLKIISAMTGI